MKKLITAGLILLAMSLASFQASASLMGMNLIENGSFEEFDDGQVAPGPGDWDYYSALPGWVGVNNIEIHGSPFLATAQHGNYYAELNAHPAQDDSFHFEQKFKTHEYAKYNLSFYAQKRRDDDGLFSVSAGDLSEDISTHDTGEWTLFEYVFKATAPYTTLSFLSGQSGDDTTGHFIDNIHVSKVPLPGAAVLLLGGLLGLSSFKRKATADA